MQSLLLTTVWQNIGTIFEKQEYIDWIFDGLKTTLIISLGAALLGAFIGVLVAFAKISKSKSILMKILRGVCDVYITIIRGTPMALQLFIMYFVVFAIRGFPEELTAIIAFGINSGAYVAENIRAGVLSVDIGQTEAGRALGLKASTTMFRIVIPQAIKNVIPAICNEFIALIKETSIVGTIGVVDLTKVASCIITKTYEPFAPYIIIALILSIIF